jgi:hypothetical protein
MLTTMSEAQWAEVLAWATVIFGVVVAFLNLQALTYFAKRRDEMNADGGGPSWVLNAIFRTVLTITIVAGWLTLARGFVLWQDEVPNWLPVVNGFLLIWLLVLPRILMQVFKNREGRK